ncbi:hypothetical protein CAPTEDRAFT_106937 [Capitella teleta]|uniref:Snurportin-1 n=1 Tax=Capitella teleta TaxID=283909 RepID=R7T5I5_CAPTE|nr:hypothetical protein CAPTEDRAFT_106937 [Capitella teleta]|eukprot:ELT88614.1 hypothetical protein CAPTEDRAFT_106937 [Capitella teleta]
MEVTQVKLRKPGRYFKSQVSAFTCKLKKKKKNHCFRIFSFHFPTLHFFSMQLMYSEWMLEPPDDLVSDWLMMPCPVGRRNLVVASRGATKVYAKNGYQLMRFPSSLPGGCRQGDQRLSCILDCIYSEVSKTFYVLDMMNWKSHPLYDSDTECRWYLTQSHFSDNPEPRTVSKYNPYKFEPLPSCSCDPESIERMMTADMNVELDGLLFYHKRTHYTIGPTPLVLWLKPYMLQELFGVKVGEKHLQNVPSSYRNFQQHVNNVKDAKKKNLKTENGCRGDAGTAMETEITKS